MGLKATVRTSVEEEEGEEMGAFHILQTFSGSQAAKLSPQSPQGIHRWMQARTKVCMCVCVCVCACARAPTA